MTNGREDAQLLDFVRTLHRTQTRPKVSDTSVSWKEAIQAAHTFLSKLCKVIHRNRSSMCTSNQNLSHAHNGHRRQLLSLQVHLTSDSIYLPMSARWTRSWKQSWYDMIINHQPFSISLFFSTLSWNWVRSKVRKVLLCSTRGQSKQMRTYTLS